MDEMLDVYKMKLSPQELRAELVASWTQMPKLG
jgi:hypothetical protein